MAKTAFFKRYLPNSFTPSCSAFGLEVHPFVFITSHGDDIEFRAWDISCRNFFGRSTDGYYGGTNAMIFFFNANSYSSYKNIEYSVRLARNYCNNIPMMICGSNTYNNSWKMSSKQKRVLTDTHGCLYYDVSTEEGLDNSFVDLVSRLTGYE